MTAEPIVNGYDAAGPTLFLEIQNKLDEEAEHSQLEWIYQNGWSREFAVARNNDLEQSAPVLHTISTILRLAYEKGLHDILKLLLDTLANAVRDEGMGTAP